MTLPFESIYRHGFIRVAVCTPQVRLGTAKARGGFGGSLASREQRIDVTGHVASGFIKCVENRITEPAT